MSASDFSSAVNQRIRHAIEAKAKELDLSRMRLQELPDEIRKITGLTRLNLAYTNISSLPAWLGELSCLRELQIQFTPISLKSLIDSPTSGQLTSFSISWPERLPKNAFSTLTNLRTLVIHQGRFRSLVPAELSELITLERLMMRNCKFIGHPNFQTALQLNSFICINSTIDTIPELSSLEYIEELRLVGLHLRSIPESITALRNLNVLDVSRNSLSTIPSDIDKLNELRYLNVSKNKLTRLPKSILNIEQLAFLNLAGNSGLELPPDLFNIETSRDFSAPIIGHDAITRMLRYYFKSQDANRSLNEAKLLILGRGDVGKTCLVNRLIWDKFEETDKTPGININQWELRVNRQNVRLNIWDFGGQEIMHATHRFFLTERSLYLVVINGREGGEDQDVEYWIKLISSFGGDSAILIALNKYDQHPCELNYTGLRRKYPQIAGFVKTDCKTGTGITKLRSAIYEALANMSAIQVKFPEAWFSIKNILSTMESNYLSFEEYRKICSTEGESDSQAQEDLAEYLHCLGIALNYRRDARLCDTSVLNPRWVTEGIYSILNAPMLAQSRGVLRLSSLGTILPTTRYRTEKHRFIIELMRKFRLCFPYNERCDEVLVPELLGKEEPLETEEFEDSNCLTFEYHYDILPEGLFAQFIVRTRSLSEDQPRWRSGAILTWNACRALVRADFADLKISIHVKGGTTQDRKELLAILRSDFDRIHAEIPRLSVKSFIRVPNKPVLIDYKKIQLLQAQGQDHFPEVSDGKVLTLSAEDLLNTVDVFGASQKRRFVSREKYNVFCSYSHKDERLKEDLDCHLKLLQRQEIISYWHDRLLLPGDCFEIEIDEHLMFADIVVPLVSAEFLASEYCYSKEMELALARHAKGEVVIVPVILRSCDWLNSPLKHLSALPKDGKPITTWSDRSSAWTDVTKGIRNLIAKLDRTRL